jgi:hypothetical protein
VPLHLATHGGSLEHPYHFWLAYFIPICDWLVRNPDEEPNTFVECGPMTPWLEHLKAVRDLNIIKPRTALNWYLRGPEFMKYNVFEDLDDPANFAKNEGLQDIEKLRSTFFPGSVARNEILEIGVLQRNRSLPFYNSAESEIKTSGAERRSISNIGELAGFLGSEGRTSIIDTSEASPQNAVLIYSQLNVLIGQFGAGLTNMIWMPKGSLIIELRGPGRLYDRSWDDCFGKLAETLGHQFQVIEAQEDWHSPIDSKNLSNQIKKLIGKKSKPISSFMNSAKKNWRRS